jgi:SAM-dependent methyltransferase
MKNFKKDYSKLYDSFYKKKNYSKEISILKKIIKKKKKLKILELGCGTGNYTKKLVPYAKKIIAIDRSKYMISEAKKKNIKKTNFLVREIKNLNFKNYKFDLIISFFHILSYQTKKFEIKKFFELSKYLNNGGYFLFDYWFENGVNYLNPKITNKFFNINKLEIQRKVIPSWNKKNKVITSKILISLKKNDKIIKKINEFHPMRYFSINEIEKYANKSQLKLLSHLGENFKNRPRIIDWSVLSIFTKI